MHQTYYTFGQSHKMPDGTPAKDQFVIVSLDAGAEQHIDPRALFMAWLGSNVFAGEYNEDDWRYTKSFYPDVQPYAVITIAERAIH